MIRSGFLVTKIIKLYSKYPQKWEGNQINLMVSRVDPQWCISGMSQPRVIPHCFFPCLGLRISLISKEGAIHVLL